MQLQRYKVEELRDICEDLFFSYLASSEDLFYNNKTYSCNNEHTTPVHLLHKFLQDKVEANRKRIDLYKKDLKNNKGNKVVCNLLNSEISFLLKEQKILLNSNMENQKALFKRTGRTDYARTSVRIPLNKKINSFYDDLMLDVLFYDDVTTAKGKFEEYNLLEGDKIDFLKNNIEVTNMGLCLIRDNKIIYVSCLKGNVKEPLKFINTFVVFPELYSDFDRLKLSDTNSIVNNDIKQYFQSKIDIDKENKELLARKYVRGDLYEIHSVEGSLFIRYSCPSTGRVYFNEIIPSNLSMSKYYKKDDYESFIDSWWSISNLGAPVEGPPMIRC